MNTQTGNLALIDLIRAEIQRNGPVSFAWFMEQALYHPEHGYYSSGRCAIGRKGDYFTNVSVGPLFGQLLAAQFAEIWKKLGEIDDFVVVEQGAHDGQFARDVLQSAQTGAPDFFEALRYQIVEPFSILQERQSRMLEVFGNKVEWRSSLEPFTGVHFSNELLDAMPVRLIAGGMERLVDLQGGSFVFVERPVSRGLTASRSTRQDTTFNQGALNWVDDIAASLQRGYVIAIDYGNSGDELPSDVQVRARHRLLNSPFEEIGNADITMHVDWAGIVNRAERQGLHAAGFTDQHHFLTAIISTWPDLLQDHSMNPARVDPKTKRALQTLLHPEMLGRAFQVLALAKNVDSDVSKLTGFKFASRTSLTPKFNKPAL